MAYDRFIDFKKGKAPSKEDVGKALEDYLGGFMVSNEWGGGRWMALLVGTMSWPFLRLEPEDSISAKAAAAEAGEERYIEVFIGKESINVITRRQDWATNRLADGFAKLVAQYWAGFLVMDE